MASYRKKGYTAKDFKKDRALSAPPDLAPECPSDSDSSENDDSAVFSNEDKLISRLYREVVDEIMSKNSLRERTVDSAIEEMKQEIHQGHRKGFRRFLGTDFGKPENRCAYLRRYAVCHTGLVKQLMGRCFSPKNKNATQFLAMAGIRTQPHLKVVSLGGGPGNDLVGFCAALQEIDHTVEEMDLYVVDVDRGWKDVFPLILRKASQGDFGLFSQCLRAFKINTGFMAADLMARGIFNDEKLSSTLAQADLVFMVKLTSFLPNNEAGDLIRNVSDSMKPEAKLIFIDQPYDGDFFRGLSCLNFVYHDYLKYELSFRPAKYHSPSIQTTQAHVGVYEKEYDLSDSDSD